MDLFVWVFSSFGGVKRRMDGTSNLDFQQGTPAVVIDKVSMTYKVDSSGPVSRRGIKANAARIIGRGSGTEVQALKELSLVAMQGEVIGVIGLNGSGKSTLMKLICGKVKPTEGQVFASSVPMMLGVSAALVPDLSGAHNIMLGCLAMGMSNEEILDKYDTIMELSGLEESIHLPMRSYSSGMASRLRFAIAVSIEPEILIIDEALNTGDDEFKDRTKKRMDEVRAQAGCVFLVSHSLNTIRDLCTRLVWLDKGDLLYDGEPEQGINWYRKYTAELAKKDRFAAGKIRRRMLRDLQILDIQPKVAGRRKQVTT
ncbi:ATP-binding cassette domain-containing protein [Arthrobacter gengyunqii]|uniref:ATP-binding cassette domain-containing protein n=1 Tax=Arthrobacter gengyunqii TaxID=2886940 RepID=A0A9X1M325_9MICC|nr:ATP-binding cassette domain-containing protein [Arthrobacter gengyunqii]MCC3269910.1 ATP-binding cassette domain-containing protein [Arthrobacter gengyunqii]UOY95159.1 ATP-binding cassette domain-containing protein [Arthrobacter gengyunqii]